MLVALSHLHELYVLPVRAIVAVTMSETSVAVKTFVFFFDVK